MPNYVKRYIPKVLSENDEMNNLYGVQSEETSDLNTDIKTILDNNFIGRADLDGVIAFEKIKNIKPDSTYSLAERKTNVQNKMMFRPPFTRQRLQNILEGIYGNGNYTFEIQPNVFRVIIDINTTNPIVYLQFSKDVRNVIPANMYLIFAIQYTYLYLSRNYTYNNMSTLTYGDLSQYDTDIIGE